MPKVTNPLFSGDARGKFGRLLIFTRGGQVRIYFKPKNPNTAAQRAVREAFKEFSMTGLTQEQADLLYSAILHLHDDNYSPLGHLHDGNYSPLGHLHDGNYSPLGHLHDDRYPQLTHTHKQILLLGTSLEDGTLAAGASNTAKPFRSGLGGSGFNVAIPVAGTLKNLYFRTGGTQPGTGSLTCTLNVNNSQKSIIATCAAGSAAGTFTDLTHTYTLSAGDVVWFDLKNNASGLSAPIVSVLIMLEFNVG